MVKPFGQLLTYIYMLKRNILQVVIKITKQGLCSIKIIFQYFHEYLNIFKGLIPKVLGVLTALATPCWVLCRWTLSSYKKQTKWTNCFTPGCYSRHLNKNNKIEYILLKYIKNKSTQFYHIPDISSIKFLNRKWGNFLYKKYGISKYLNEWFLYSKFSIKSTHHSEILEPISWIWHHARFMSKCLAILRKYFTKDITLDCSLCLSVHLFWWDKINDFQAKTLVFVK